MNRAYCQDGTERVLIMLAKDGDVSAYTELYRLHAKRVFHTALKITGNREDAEDVLQEASMKALVHLSGFDGRSKFSTWLTRIAINSALMMRRKSRNRVELPIDHEGDSGVYKNLQVVDKGPDPEHWMRMIEIDSKLNRAMQRLSGRLREPLELQLAEDISVKELAVRLGISVPAAKSRLMRARAQVRCSMAGGMRSRLTDRGSVAAMEYSSENRRNFKRA